MSTDAPCPHCAVVDGVLARRDKQLKRLQQSERKSAELKQTLFRLLGCGSNARIIQEVERLQLDRLSLAQLAADEPQFFSPLRVAEVKRMRDAVLHKAAKAPRENPHGR